MSLMSAPQIRYGPYWGSGSEDAQAGRLGDRLRADLGAGLSKMFSAWRFAVLGEI